MKRTLLLLFFALGVGLMGWGQGVFTSKVATGNWNAAGSWTLNSGTDVDGIPDSDDNVTIIIGNTISLTADAACYDLTLQGTSGTRLAIGNFVLEVGGTLNGPGTSFTNTIVTTGTGKLKFIGNSRALFGANWAASHANWRCEVALNANQTGTASTNVKIGFLIVTSGILQIGTTSSTKDLRIDGSSDGTGTISIASGATLIATGILGARTATATTYCGTIDVNGILTVQGSRLNGTLNINNGGKLLIKRLSNAAGLVSDPANGAATKTFNYATGATLQYDLEGAIGKMLTGSEINYAGTTVGTKDLYNLIVNNSNGINIQASPTIAGTCTITAGDITTSSGQTVKYGTNGTLLYNGSSSISSTDMEFPSTNGPKNLTIENTAGVTLHADRAVNGTLTVKNNAIFDASTFVVSGTGDFDVQAGATIKSGHADGLNGNNTTSGGLSLYDIAANYTFNGSAEQVTGTYLPATVNNLTIDNAAGVKLSNAALTVTGTMQINTGKLFTLESTKQLTVSGTLTNSAGNTGLVIESDATGTGSLVNNSGSVGATVKQYMSNVTTWGSSVDGWHFLSSPVANQGVSGSFTPSGSNYDFFRFDESSYTWMNQKVPENSITEFGSGTGYLVAYEVLDTKSFIGTLYDGDRATPVSLTPSLPDTQEGWNLIGNPFCSSIDWDLVTKTTIASAFYIRNAANDGWSSYADGTGTNYNSDGHIPPMQGFFVRATTTGSVTFPFTARVHGTQDFTKGTAEVPVNVIKLKTRGNDQSDEWVVRFRDDATPLFDNNSDAYKFISDNGTIPQIYSVFDDVFYSINSLPVPTGELVIPVYIRVGQISTIELLQQDNTLVPELTYWMEDMKTGQKFDLTEGSYSFTASPNDDYLRFRLHILKSTGIENTEPLSGLNIYSFANTLYFNTTLSLDAQIQVFNITGQEVYSTRTQLDGMKQFSLNVPTGWYVVKVMCDEGIKSEKIFIW